MPCEIESSLDNCYEGTAVVKPDGIVDERLCLSKIGVLKTLVAVEVESPGDLFLLLALGMVSSTRCIDCSVPVL